MNRLEEIFENLPEVQKEKGVVQNEYHAYDVFNHTKEVVKHLENKNPNLIVAAYLHDIGKPVVAKPRLYDGVLQFDKHGNQMHTFPNHEFAGAEMVQNIDEKLFIDNGLNKNYVILLVKNHYEPMKYINKKLRKAKNKSEFILAFEEMNHDLRSKDVDIEDLMDLFLADTMGKGGESHEKDELILIKDAILGKNCLKNIYDMQAQLGGMDYRHEIKEKW